MRCNRTAIPLLFTISAAFVIICLLSSSFFLHVDASRELRVGVCYSASGTFAQYGNATVVTATAWRDWENTYGLAVTRDIQVKLVFYDVASSAPAAIACTKYLINVAQVQVLLTGEGALAGVSAALAPQFPSVLFLVATSGDPTYFYTSDNQRLNKNVFGLATMSTSYYGSFYRLAQSFTPVPTTLAFVTTGLALALEVTTGSTTDALQSGLSIVTSEIITYQVPYTVDYEYTQLLASLTKIKALQPNLDILATATIYSCTTLGKALKAIDFSPKAVLVWDCAANIASSAYTTQQQQDARYFSSAVQWSADLRGQTYTDKLGQRYASMFTDNSTDSAKQFITLFAKTAKAMYTQSQLAGPPSNVSDPLRTPYFSAVQSMTSFAPVVMSALYMVSSTVYRANVTDEPGAGDTLVSYAGTTYIPRSFAGTIGVSDVGVVTRDNVLIQIEEDLVPHVIYPGTAANSRVTVYPLPSWTDRISNYDYLTLKYEYVVLVFIIILAISMFFVVCGMILYRAEPQVAASSFGYSLVIMVGCIMGVLSPLTWLHNSNSTGCLLRYPILMVSFTLMHVPILLKAYRFNAIFQHKKLTIWGAKDNLRLLLGLSATILAVIGFVCAWQGAAPMKSTIILVDQSRPANNYVECQVDAGKGSTNNAFSGVFIAYVVVLVVLGVNYAYKLALIDAELGKTTYDYDKFRETGPIIVVLYFELLVILVILLLQLVGSDNTRDAIIGVRAFAVMLLCSVVAMAMCGWRLVRLWRQYHGVPLDSRPSRLSSGQVAPLGGSGSGLSAEGKNSGAHIGVHKSSAVYVISNNASAANNAATAVAIPSPKKVPYHRQLAQQQATTAANTAQLQVSQEYLYQPVRKSSSSTPLPQAPASASSTPTAAGGPALSVGSPANSDNRWSSDNRSSPKGPNSGRNVLINTLT